MAISIFGILGLWVFWAKVFCPGAGQKNQFQMRQNRRFWKWDKTADSENETKQPIL